jgi:iron complex transport system substrate-binding protein
MKARFEGERLMIARRFFLAFVFGAVACSALHAQPQRIVSTAPSITEMLYALGLGDRVVGVTTFCHYPPEAQKKPKIGTYVDPNVEAIAALRPDLVITQTNPTRLTERLRALRLAVLEIDQENIERLYGSFRSVGQATGVPDRAASLIQSVQGKLAGIRERAAKYPRRRVLFAVGRSPNGLDGLYAVGRASYLNEIIELAGGDNVFRDTLAPYPAVTLEEVIARNPEVIVDMGDMANTIGVTEGHKQRVVALWQQLPRVEAVKQKRVFAVAADIYVVPGPRVVDAAQAFLQMLHPEASRR